MRLYSIAGLALVAALLAGAPAAAAPATPAPGLPQPLIHPPATAEHTSFVIEINKRGQVSKVRSRKGSGNREFDSVVLGNVVQTFVRRPNGRAVPGVYRMNYDYDPGTKNVRRTVELLHAGGVDAAAPGMVDKMAAVNRRTEAKLQKILQAQAKHAPAKAKASPAASPAASTRP